MKARDWFGVIVRSIGLCLVLVGLYYVMSYFVTKSLNIDQYALMRGTADLVLGSMLKTSLTYIVVGLLLMKGAGLVVWFCYGPDRSE